MAQASIADRGIFSFVDEATYGTDPGAGYVEWQPKAMPDLSSLKQTLHDNERMVSANYRESKVLGVKSDATLSLEWWLRGLTDTPPTNLPAIGAANPDVLMMGHMLGGIKAAAGVTANPTVEAAPAPALDAFTVSSATDLTEGELCVLYHAALGTYEIFRIKTIAVAALTLTDPLRVIPVTGDTVYGSLMAWMTDTAASATLTMNLETTAYDTDSTQYFKHVMSGCRGAGGKVTWTAGEFASLAADYMIGTFTSESSEAAPPVFVADAFPPREALIGGRVYWRTDEAVPTAGCFEASSIEFDPGLDVKRPKVLCEDVEATGEPEFGLHTPKFTINPLLRQDMAPFAAAGNKISLLIQIGSVPGRMILACAPRCGFGEMPTISNDDQIARQAIVLVPEVYAGDGAAPLVRDTNTVTPKDASVAFGWA